MPIDEFEKNYKSFCECITALESDVIDGFGLVEIADRYSFLKNRNIDLFFRMLEYYNLNYDEVIVQELESISEAQTTQLSGLFSTEFRTYYSSYTYPKLVLISDLLLFKKSSVDCTMILCKEGEKMLARSDWGRILCILEVLPIYKNTAAISFMKDVIEQLLREPEYYHGELGIYIFDYLDEIPRDAALDLISKYRDNSIEAFSRNIDFFIRQGHKL